MSQQVVITTATGDLLNGGESFMPDLDEAIASCGGDEFHYRLCEERPLELPDAEVLRWWIIDYIDDHSSLCDSDPAAGVADRVKAEIDALVEALVARNDVAWYPVGAAMTYTPEIDL